MSERAFVGIGSNLGDRASMIDQAIRALDRSPAIAVVQCSSLWETDPVGPPQPKYLNGAVELATTLNPHALLDALLEIERSLGRSRTENERNAPRTIDLDILLFGERVVSEFHLEIPHPRLALRPFALVPLIEIDASLIYPQGGDLLLSLLSVAGGNDGVVMWRARKPSSVT